MKLTVLVPALAGLLWAGSALADAQLEVTTPYVVQLIDGQSINPKLLDKTSTFPLSAGKHQLVIAFEGNFSNRSEIKLVTAEPLVLNFTAADNQKLVLDYKKPRNETEAKQFVKEQKVALKDKVSGQQVSSEQFVMPKVEGFQLTRDYQQELINMGPDPAAKLVQQGRCGNPQSFPDLGYPAAISRAEILILKRGAGLPFFISRFISHPWSDALMSLHIFYHPLYSSLTLSERHRFPLAKYQGLFETARQRVG